MNKKIALGLLLLAYPIYAYASKIEHRYIDPYTQADVGLSNVDNTSDVNKPVSTAQAAANTADRARANHTGTQPLATISDVTVTATQVNNIQSGADYPGHFHSSDRARANHTGTQLASTVSDFTSAAKAAAVDNAITAGITDKAPSEGSVFTALAAKEATANKGVAGGYAALTAENIVSPVNGWPSAPQKYSVLFDDFISDGGAGTIAGTLGWNVNKVGTGSSVTSGGYADAFNQAQGVVNLNTGTTATGRTTINLAPGGMGAGYSTIDSIYRVIIPTLSTVTDEFICLVGYGDNFGAGTANTNGISFVYDRLTSVNWLARNTAGGVTTVTNTGVAVTTGFNKLEIQVNGAGTSIVYKINGTTVATNTTNIPGFGQNFAPYFKIVKSAGTASRSLSADYFSLKMIWTATR